MRALTLSLRVLLLLAVTLVSGHQAVGRAMAKGAVALELCSDGALVTVTLDAQGNPVAHPHACPDCVLSGLAVEAGTPDLRLPRAAGSALAREWGGLMAHPLDQPHPAARGPLAELSSEIRKHIQKGGPTCCRAVSFLPLLRRLPCRF